MRCKHNRKHNRKHGRTVARSWPTWTRDVCFGRNSASVCIAASRRSVAGTCASGMGAGVAWRTLALAGSRCVPWTVWRVSGLCRRPWSSWTYGSGWRGADWRRGGRLKWRWSWHGPVGTRTLDVGPTCGVRPLTRCGTMPRKARPDTTNPDKAAGSGAGLGSVDRRSVVPASDARGQHGWDMLAQIAFDPDAPAAARASAARSMAEIEGRLGRHAPPPPRATTTVDQLTRAELVQELERLRALNRAGPAG